MSKDDRDLLEEYETAEAPWAGLSAKYSRTSESRANDYLSKITQFEFDESSSLDVAWSRLKEYRRKLVSANTDMKNAFPDKALFLFMTRSLPLAYKPTDDGFRVATSMDIDEKLRILHEVEEDTRAETAIKARQRTSRHRRVSDSSTNSNGCYLCRGDHTVRLCKDLSLARSLLCDFRRIARSNNDKKNAERADQSIKWRSKDKKEKKLQELRPKGYAATD